MTLNPFGRLFIPANDEDKDLLVLPDTTPDMVDKLHILRCNAAESPMRTSTEKERAASTARPSQRNFPTWLPSSTNGRLLRTSDTTEPASKAT